jgi:alpha-L-rhamnosidase
MRFAEILNPDGSIYTPNLRNADATDLYILRGEGQESFTPHFTFHGFRYVEVTG